MTEAINAHKKMAMGMTEGNKMKRGGKVKRYAEGGKVMPESKAATLINDSSQKRPLPRPLAGVEGKIATHKNGGKIKPMGMTIVIGMKKAGRGK